MTWKYLWLFVSCIAGIINVLCLSHVYILLGAVAFLTAVAAFGAWVQEQVT